MDINFLCNYCIIRCFYTRPFLLIVQYFYEMVIFFFSASYIFILASEQVRMINNNNVFNYDIWFAFPFLLVNTKNVFIYPFLSVWWRNYFIILEIFKLKLRSMLGYFNICWSLWAFDFPCLGSFIYSNKTPLQSIYIHWNLKRSSFQ